MDVEYRYLDVLWLDNFVMNFVILWITLKISKNKGVVWRLCLAAGIGALYAVVLFLPGFEILQQIPLKIALSLVMLMVAFEFLTFKDFFKLLSLFYVTTFIFGGVALGLYFFTQDFVDITKGAFVIKNYPVNKLMMTCILAMLLLTSAWRFIRLHLPQEELLYKVEIQFGEKKVIVDALLDTGNTLLDPISQYPVIVTEFNKIKEVLPNEVQEIFSKSLEGDLKAVTQIMGNSSWVGKFRIIPYSALGKPNGMLIGFKPDRVHVLKKGGWHTIENVVIGVYNNKLSKHQHYQALVNPEIVA